MDRFRERLTVPMSWWAAGAALALTCGWIVLVAIGTVPAVVTAAVVAVLVAAALVQYGSLTIEVGPDGFRAGRAHLPAAHVAGVVALHRVEYRARLGVDGDARDHLVTRPYVDRGVLVSVGDPNDPTPHWVVSSRRPDDLAAAVLSLQEGSRVEEA